jgi:outer membrane receptor for ferrienterochelin and colicin
MSTARTTSTARAFCLLAAAFGVSATGAQAQDGDQAAPARLQGVVVMGSTFQPISDAVVTIVGTDLEVRTGPMGQFALADAPEGMNWVRVAVEGFPSVREQVDIRGDGVVFLQFQMPTDVTALLAEMQVDVVTRATEAGEAQTALDLLTQKVPGIKLRNTGNIGDNDGAVRLRGFSSLTQDGNPIIVIDDVIARGAAPLELLDRIPAVDVDSIQVLKGPAATTRYPWAANGVIRVTTRRN